MNSNLFITFEGPEGAGKTTVIQMIAERLTKNNIEVLATREPGGIEIAEKIRTIILNPAHTAMDERTEALLYAAARSQHYFEKVRPALDAGKLVICDRFIDSSLAYQGYARGIGMSDIYQINKFAVGEYMPDLNILFDVSPQIGLSRINKNKGREVNRLDLEKMDFHNKVREGYHKLYEGNKDKFIKIDAEKSIEEVFSEVKEIIINFIE